MVNASRRLERAVGGFIFLRPCQTEATYLQFGDLLSRRGATLDNAWRVLKES